MGKIFEEEMITSTLMTLFQIFVQTTIFEGGGGGGGGG